MLYIPNDYVADTPLGRHSLLDPHTLEFFSVSFLEEPANPADERDEQRRHHDAHSGSSSSSSESRDSHHSHHHGSHSHESHEWTTPPVAGK